MLARALVLAGACALLVPVSAQAVAPEGPRLAFVRTGLGREAIRIVSTNPIGAAWQQIVGRRTYRQPLPYPFLGPAWSPDGNRLAYTGVVRRFRLEAKALPTKIFLVSATGGWSEAIPGTSGGFAPVFSPDGRLLAFTRGRQHWQEREDGVDLTYESYSAWLLDLATGVFRQLTPWRNGLVNAPSSFSPDGRVLALDHRAPGGQLGTKLIPLGGSGSTMLMSDGFSVQYSPDGSRITFLRGRWRVFRGRRSEGNATLESTIRTIVTDLFAMRPDGSGVRRLTNTPTLTESAASWDPSGQRLAFTRIEAGTDEGFFGFGAELMAMNADGSCPTTILWEPYVAFAGPVWQPGPGRGAGRIAC